MSAVSSTSTTTVKPTTTTTLTIPSASRIGALARGTAAALTPLSPSITTDLGDLKTLDKAAALAIAGTVGAILLGVFAVQAGIGYYVGRKLGTKWGWFWGGVFGTPGMGAMTLYRRSKGRP